MAPVAPTLPATPRIPCGPVAPVDPLGPVAPTAPSFPAGPADPSPGGADWTCRAAIPAGSPNLSGRQSPAPWSQPAGRSPRSGQSHRQQIRLADLAGRSPRRAGRTHLAWGSARACRTSARASRPNGTGRTDLTVRAVRAGLTNQALRTLRAGRPGHTRASCTNWALRAGRPSRPGRAIDSPCRPCGPVGPAGALWTLRAGKTLWTLGSQPLPLGLDRPSAPRGRVALSRRPGLLDLSGRLGFLPAESLMVLMASGGVT